MGSFWRKFIFYLAVFVFVLFMTVNGYSELLTFGIVAVVLLSFLLLYYYPLLLEKRIDRLESFLLKQKKTPAIYINYVLANRLEDEARLVIEQLMSKYKQPETQAPFKAAFGVYQKDMAIVREAVPYIRQSDYRAYYETILHIQNGERDQAQIRLESIKKQWMKLALLVEMESSAGNHEAAIQYARKAINSSRGVHCYVLYKEYERELPQAVEAIS
ncbi:hypothetical protein J45TS6_35040 [Paenibacillus sp. J45TS6]|uniref:hypothetical protein n=1 Tax=Paenibacillus sp. J45TS6 TaxID=2807196 RepID=UPI001B2338B8|nr:hypothetical protein [Paenibacillus sp. J45TS6]GIP45045.1 hypothetical protein J45TS6_35040 [Paenibacillus sp. J45TS6]